MDFLPRIIMTTTATETRERDDRSAPIANSTTCVIWHWPRDTHPKKDYSSVFQERPSWPHCCSSAGPHPPRHLLCLRPFDFTNLRTNFKRRILIQPSGGDSNRHPFIQRPSQLGVSKADNFGMNDATPSPLAAKFVPAQQVMYEWNGAIRKIRTNHRNTFALSLWRISFFGQFFLVVYNDQYHASLHEVWHVTVQSMLRVDVHGLVGQGTR